ncbi:MAG: UPF0104 family protein, partial [Pseudonocardiales bacterium]|nr:UPF0104 family protein [Pseudonocardiales bacterium]
PDDGPAGARYARRARGIAAELLAFAVVGALLPLLLLALMAMGLPISVGGWGPREGVAAVSFWMAGLGAPLGVTVSVAYGVLTLIASLPGAFVVLMGRRRAATAAAEAGAGAASQA